jgi:hypothetical protein
MHFEVLPQLADILQAVSQFMSSLFCHCTVLMQLYIAHHREPTAQIGIALHISLGTL